MSIKKLQYGWTLSCTGEAMGDLLGIDGGISVEMPVEVHQTLLAQGLIEHPYVGLNEADVQWVAAQTWVLEKAFELSVAQVHAPCLELQIDELDTLAEICLNGVLLYRADNMFLRHRIDLKPAARQGENRLCIKLLSAPAAAVDRAKKLPFPIPYNANNNRVPHMNLLRKAQCHAGWDWGICLMVTGVYQVPKLIVRQRAQLHYLLVEQRHTENTVELTLRLEAEVYSNGELPLEIVLNGEPVIAETLSVQVGALCLARSFTVKNPALWWPAGQGEQPLYELGVILADASLCKTIGLRELEVVTQADDIGLGLKVRVNGRDVFCKGANWIPADALTLDSDGDRYRDLLTAAVLANMNCLRLWGGGFYERDIFYQLCDELGLLIWHDLMFACSLYPSTREFVASAAAEVKHQIKRLAHHPSIALWCGDNEVMGAIDWYEQSRRHREKYIVNYDRLNRALARVVGEGDPTRRFWPSSPCNGELDFGDAWHIDHSGDMHYWDVWHSGSSFEAYYTVRPRFCSEFGFQSLPSLPAVARFAEPSQWNVSSPVMESHQKSPAGNAIIMEMFTRYFRFPESFVSILYLSQVQQAVAIKTAVEYWRSLQPHCMGTLFWQLNDNWPVASWSSIEHGGRWKQLHYHARRFFNPILVALVPEARSVEESTVGGPAGPIKEDVAKAAGNWVLKAVSDAPGVRNLEVEFRQITLGGKVVRRWPLAQQLRPGDSATLLTLNQAELAGAREDSFFAVVSDDPDINNTFYLAPWKAMTLPQVCIEQEVVTLAERVQLTLKADAPAHFLTLEHPASGRWSDNSFTLLPGEDRTVDWLPSAGSAVPENFAEHLVITHLRSTYQ
ncbi:beta-mannosidase [Exilibacterium tricleocarpae]|nr:glycoside hydrolase family 2 protein [Exilibacterium tricleocarpae]